MELYIKDARERWKRFYVFLGIFTGTLFAFSGILFGCLIMSEDTMFGLIFLAVFCGVGVLFALIFVVVAFLPPSFAAELATVRQNGETGINVDGVIVGRTIAYIPTKRNMLIASAASFKKPFVIYTNVYDVVRKPNMTIFTMLGGKKQFYFNSDFSPAAFDAICQNMRAAKNVAAPPSGGFNAGDIVYDDYNSGLFS